MIETVLLEHLVAFYDCKTLSRAAEKLHISQPSLTRSMQRLEEEFGVSLFERSKNRISLNENGELAAECARLILAEQEAMLTRVRALERSRRTIAIGAIAPGPMLELSAMFSAQYPDRTVSTEFRPAEELIQNLELGLYQLIILPETPNSEAIIAHLCGSEHLYANLPASHPLANCESVSFAELDGENFLMASEVGFWDQIVRTNMPNAQFHLQGPSSLMAVIASSTMPSFATDLTLRLYGSADGRVYVPFSDESAVTRYYCCCRREDELKFHIWFQALERRYNQQ